MPAYNLLIPFSLPLLMALSNPLNAMQSGPTDSEENLTFDHTPALRAELLQTLNALDQHHTPRTRHKNALGHPLYTNRLIKTSSPYLLQHAHNPVDWYSWGEEAFNAAKESDKPIFISIGYSTCHWCHVMAKESFENIEIAQYLNKHFISIKIDREQRPDIDATYMQAASMLNGQTGWPLNTLTTPSGIPFYSVTYTPPEALLKRLKQTKQRWDTDRVKLTQKGQQVLSAIKQINTPPSKTGSITQNTYRAAISHWLAIYDEFEPGFGTAPKFPQESTLLFFLDQATRKPDRQLLTVITQILDAMQQGGIYDQIGGGFHRYATDPGWQVPHFEKMLYNQAQLVRVYLKAFSLTGNPAYRRTVDETLNYVLNEMRSPSGLFYSASDADSEGTEGKYFLWDTAEIRQLLSDDEFTLMNPFWGLNQGTNFDGFNILYQPLSPAEFVIQYQIPANQLLTTLQSAKTKLYLTRQKRVAPHLDRKYITAWNGMMIQALSEAAYQLNNERYLTAAIQAAEQLWEHHYVKGDLLRDSHSRSSGAKGNLADYAYLGLSNWSLYRITHNRLWLDRALELTDQMFGRFWEKKSHILHYSTDPIINDVQARSQIDKALPAAESVALELLTLIGQSQPDQRYATISSALFATKAPRVNRTPMDYSYLLLIHANQNNNLDPIQFGAQGALRAELIQADDQLSLNIKLAPGWHINAHNPGDKRLIAATLSADWLSDVIYPAAKKRSVNFTEQPIELYSGEQIFKLKLERSKIPVQPGSPLNFRYQACSNRICLPPETLSFLLPR